MTVTGGPGSGAGSGSEAPRSTRAFLRAWRALHASCALSGVLGLGLCAVPLFGVHGVESALVLGAVLPPSCAALGARVAIGLRGDAQAAASRLLTRAIASALCVLAVPVIVLALNALRVRNCDPVEGLTFILLGPAFGVVLAAVCGAALGALRLRPWLATALAVLVPLADAARALADFYGSPAVFAYGHFFGYFPGPLYDELIELPGPLWTLRAVTAAVIVGLVAGIAAHYERASASLRLRPRGDRKALSALALGCAAVLGLTCAHASALGHRGSDAHVEQALGGRHASVRCDLYVPRELRRERRRRLAEDCDFRVGQMERFFGVSQRAKVRVLLFRSAAEKRVLMGAGGTNVAKPWRNEIYLQDDAFPHPVMAHEIAHIVAGNFGRGPFRVSGALGAWVPDFALVEGMAVAAAWNSSASAALTPHQWTRALLELGLLPSLGELFGGGFFAQPKRLGYTVSGSFLRWVAERHGSRALRQLSLDGDLGALGEPVPVLEAAFHAYLREVELPEVALALARQRFEGKSVLSAVCPHERAKLRGELDGYLVADDGREARRVCGELLAIDPGDGQTRATHAALLARAGDEAGAGRELAALRSAGAPPSLLAGLRHALADEAWRRGDHPRAAAGYGELLREPLDRDSLRMLQVKALALGAGDPGRKLIFDILVGEPGQSTDGATAVYLARELRRARTDGLPQYLEARQLMLRERYVFAADLLAEARRLGLPSAELAFEALRTEASTRCAAGQKERAVALWKRAREIAPAVALREEAEEWLQRCAPRAGR